MGNSCGCFSQDQREETNLPTTSSRNQQSTCSKLTYNSD